MAENLVETKKIQSSKKNDNLFNTETMLPISEIRGNTIILKDGGLRGIVKIFGLNLDLRNYDEQQIVIEQYKRFLNGLNFPIQLMVRSTYLDLTDYINFVKDQVDIIENDVLKDQGFRYSNFLEEINSKQGLIYTKEFYIIVPYYEAEADMNAIRRPWWKKFFDALDTNDSPEKIVARYRRFIKNKKNLDSRCSIISEGLGAIGMATERMELNELVSLLFKMYNPNSHKQQSEAI